MGSAWNGTQDATWHKDCRLTVLNSEPNICRGDKGGRKETKGHCCVQNLHFCFITSFAADNIYFGTSKSPQNLHYLYTLPTRQNLHNQFCSGQNLNWHKQVPAESTSPVLLRTESTLDEASNPAESALPVLQRTTSTLAQANLCRIYITCIVAHRIYIRWSFQPGRICITSFAADKIYIGTSKSLQNLHHLHCRRQNLLLWSSTPLLLCSSTPLLLCSSTPLLLYSSTPLLLFSSTPLLLYSSTPSSLLLEVLHW